MTYPKANGLFKFILHTYVRWLTARSFHQINYNTVDLDPNRSVLLIANHFSVWDTLILAWVSRKLLDKKFHVMVLEETMRKQPMLKYSGAFSVNKGSKDIITSLNYAAQLLNDPQNLVLIFPQGKLHSNLVSDVIFEKGIMRVMQKATGKFNLLYAATFVEHFEHYRPTATVYLKVATEPNFSDIEQVQSDYQQHYTASRQQQTQFVK